MSQHPPQRLGLIAGRGIYPLLLAEGARKAGVGHIFAVAFRGETDAAIRRLADSVAWLRMGQLGRMLDVLETAGVEQAVMAGQLTPRHLFHTRLDARTVALLRGLPVRNAHTIFRAVAGELLRRGVSLLPASSFMAEHMPAAGVLTARPPTGREAADIELGLRVARAASGLDIGQTVAVKEGTVLAVEAFEGTDETLRRAGRLAGPGIVAVKVARAGHDMRFDIPVVGSRTVALLRRIRAAALAVEAGRAIVLERDAVVAAADRAGIAVVAAPAPLEGRE
jgi:DUF1009 family protein